MFHSLLESLFQLTSSVILDPLKLALVKNGIWKLGVPTATRLRFYLVDWPSLFSPETPGTGSLLWTLSSSVSSGQCGRSRVSGRGRGRPF